MKRKGQNGVYRFGVNNAHNPLVCFQKVCHCKTISMNTEMNSEWHMHLVIPFFTLIFVGIESPFSV